ncbi:MAG: hypothetical protein IID08_09800 [Candidatus Hydrogenedentes bacterium]|nr:hypothetical protein [Candidatus Hydrogenedentota bacterium]
MKNLLWGAAVRRGWQTAYLILVAVWSVTLSIWLFSQGEDATYFPVDFLGIVLLLIFSNSLLIEELGMTRAKTLRALPLQEKDEARALWVLCVVLYPVIFLAIATALQLAYGIARDSVQNNTLLSFRLSLMFVIFTALMFCTARLFRFVSLAQTRDLRDRIGVLCYTLSMATPVFFFFGAPGETVWLATRDHFAFLSFLAFTMLWISYLNAVAVLRTQRKYGFDVGVLPLEMDNHLARFTTHGGNRRALLFMSTLVGSTCFNWLMFRLMGNTADDTMTDFFNLYMAGMLVVLMVETPCARACRSLRPLPFSRHQLTRHLVSFPLIAMLGLALGYVIALAATGVLIRPSMIVWGTFFSFVSVLLTLPVLIAAGNRIWALAFCFLMYAVVLRLVPDSILSSLPSPMSSLALFALCAIGYGSTYRLVLTKSALYRPENWVMNKGMR